MNLRFVILLVLKGLIILKFPVYKVLNFLNIIFIVKIFYVYCLEINRQRLCGIFYTQHSLNLITFFRLNILSQL